MSLSELLSVLAILVSFYALREQAKHSKTQNLNAGEQNKLTQEQNELSVKPHLIVSIKEVDGYFVKSLINVGVGSAIFKKVSLVYEGKTTVVENASTSFRLQNLIKCQGDGTVRCEVNIPLPEGGLLPGGELILFKYSEIPITTGDNLQVMGLIAKHQLKIDYESLYGDGYSFESSTNQL